MPPRPNEPVEALTADAIAAVLDYAQALQPYVAWMQAVLAEYLPSPVRIDPALLLRNPDGSQGALAVLRDPEGSDTLCWRYDVPSLMALRALTLADALPELHGAVRDLDFAELAALTHPGDLDIVLCLTPDEQALRDAWLRAAYARHIEDSYAAYPDPDPPDLS